MNTINIEEMKQERRTEFVDKHIIKLNLASYENIVNKLYNQQNEIQKLKKKLNVSNELLRRVYNVIEMSHLNDNKTIKHYLERFAVSRSLGEQIFNYLQSKDEIFKNIVIKRQKRFRSRKKNSDKRLRKCKDKCVNYDAYDICMKCKWFYMNGFDCNDLENKYESR